MRKIKLKLSDIGIIIGILLVVASVAILIFSEINQKNAAQNAKETVLVLRDLMPDVDDAVPDDRANVIMSAMEIKNESFVGIIEVPKFDCSLPIRETWKKSKADNYPCKYLGSIYDGSLIIGGSDNDGQLDFARLIENYDNVFITDMTGSRYKYTVSDIRRTKDVSTEYLTSVDADLVIFAKNSFSFDYTVIRCEFDY